MSNDAKRISQLVQATSLVATDRVVVLSNIVESVNVNTITLPNFGASLANNMPIANTTQLGVIKIGAGLAVAANGTVTAPLPVANDTALGVVQIGSGINFNEDGVISVPGISNTDGSIGRLYMSNADGVGSWKAFSGVHHLTTVKNSGASIYPVAANDSVIFVNPTAVGADVKVILPITDGILGQEITVKNIDSAATPTHKVTVVTDRETFSYLQNPIDGVFKPSYILPKNESQTWIFDSDSLYSHVGTNAQGLKTTSVDVNSSTIANSINYQVEATLLSLETKVQKLGTGGVNQPHHYYLPNGKDGQLMYITTKTGDMSEDNILIWMDNLRLPSGVVIANSYWTFNSGGWGRSLASTMFIDGAWNIDGGSWGPV
jgi:hypothetical protein